jgi:two-component system sensor histidine kinase BarA
VPRTSERPVDWLVGRRFLLADDNPVNLQLLEVLLGGYGADTVCATDGAEAVELTLGNDLDMAFIDIHMPQVDGFEAAARIAAARPDLPLIALTADVTAVERLSRGDNDFAGCLTKPLDTDALLDTVAEHLDPGTADATPETDGTDGSEAGHGLRDRERAIAQAAGSAEIADALFEHFIETLPASLHAIDQAYRAGDWPGLWQATHRLQGAAATCSTPALFDALAVLARAAKAEDAERIDEGVAEVLVQAGRFEQRRS